ncbi:polyphenol oxidase I [Cucumis melo var. makuwa]|uniref:Polyphenol oxidase I n=1 Tax=Cucumis melo var. makuwa TaxID=1194695 RepID=A0A5A7UM88_CUCMM|nr:polyphenol oxidase I [Cucumis melo var. makuwa]TYK26390.1 polyphenol oxidase I [Cucumis melo var. makuwa]
MASLSSLLLLSPYSQTKTKFSISSNKRHVVVNYVSCKAASSNNGEDSVSKFDRREVLFGLGGLYGVVTATGSVLAAPLTPDVFNCDMAQTPGGIKNCCPPRIGKIIHFVPPKIQQPYVRRPAAHLMNQTQIEELERGIQKLKQLDEDDPHSFSHQAKIHCAYCDYAYNQLGSITETRFEVHSNALFFPFHRAYLYFFERILRHYIGNPDFAIPFWNWDSPPGMHMPEFYNRPSSSLYDNLRDPRHDPHKLIDLNYNGKTEDHSFDVVDCNLRWMNDRMKVQSPRSFLGRVLKAGETPKPSDMGTIEQSPHNNIHDWVGTKTPHFEDMGSFYSAALDPLFYAHHTNIDRLWNIWKTLDGNPKDHTDPDWLNSSFVFYDENKNAVRIEVSDCLDTEKLGYVYQEVPLPWLLLNKIPSPNPWIRTEEPEPPIINFPQTLNSDITTMVDRPEEAGSGEEVDVVLVLEDVEYDPTTRVHFDVLVNVVDEAQDRCAAFLEFVGSFKNIPHGLHHHDKTSLRFVITEVIQGLGLERDKNLAVKIEPMVGGEGVTLGGIKIQLEPVFVPLSSSFT